MRAGHGGAAEVRPVRGPSGSAALPRLPPHPLLVRDLGDRPRGTGISSRGRYESLGEGSGFRTRQEKTCWFPTTRLRTRGEGLEAGAGPEQGQRGRDKAWDVVRDTGKRLGLSLGRGSAGKGGLGRQGADPGALQCHTNVPHMPSEQSLSSRTFPAPTATWGGLVCGFSFPSVGIQGFAQT